MITGDECRFIEILDELLKEKLSEECLTNRARILTTWRGPHGMGLDEEDQKEQQILERGFIIGFRNAEIMYLSKIAEEKVKNEFTTKKS